MVELQFVVLAVAGSSPVGRPFPFQGHSTPECARPHDDSVLKPSDNKFAPESVTLASAEIEALGGETLDMTCPERSTVFFRPLLDHYRIFTLPAI
jgi:hypothetical protein